MPSERQMRLVERIPAAVLTSLSKSTFGSSVPWCITALILNPRSRSCAMKPSQVTGSSVR